MTTTPDNLEIEVKFFVIDADDICRRLAALGAKAGAKVFESNIRFEDCNHSLKTGGKLLRLRRDQSCRLTYKCRPQQTDSECKVLQELEVEVGNFDTMAGILEALGYCRVQIYEKWRRTFAWGDVEICLDMMPFGTFLEIEGPEESIKTTAAKLGLAWSERILANYLAIFELLRRKYGLTFNDVTFSEFDGHPVDIVPLLARLQVGEMPAAISKQNE